MNKVIWDFSVDAFVIIFVGERHFFMIDMMMFIVIYIITVIDTGTVTVTFKCALIETNACATVCKLYNVNL